MAEPHDTVGVAEASEAGAVVRAQGRALVVDGLAAWPDGVVGGLVAVTGVVHGDDSVRASPTWVAVGFPVPWRVQFDDGRHNGWTIAQSAHDAELTWSYRPMTAAMSSSGVYDGGPPAQGVRPAAEARAVYALVAALLEDPACRVTTRAMGTGALTVTRPSGEQSILIDVAAASTLSEGLGAWAGVSTGR